MKISKGTVAAVLALAVLCLAAASDGWVVKIQTTQLRKTPQFFGATTATLKAGDRLTQIAESGAWVQVRTASGLIGWVHKSAVEVPRFALMASAGGTKTSATASEAALAGKGFGPQVEDMYKAKHADANFAAVDRMLQLKIPAAELQDFLAKGKLGQGGER
ncbi:MAG: SH3 domain-containing protein [Candidatus Aminicenantales bacterium]